MRDLNGAWTSKQPRHETSTSMSNFRPWQPSEIRRIGPLPQSLLLARALSLPLCLSPKAWALRHTMLSYTTPFTPRASVSPTSLPFTGANAREGFPAPFAPVFCPFFAPPAIPLRIPVPLTSGSAPGRTRQPWGHAGRPTQPAAAHRGSERSSERCERSRQCIPARVVTR